MPVIHSRRHVAIWCLLSAALHTGVAAAPEFAAASTRVISSQATAPATPNEDLATWTIARRPGGDLGLTFSLGWTLGTHQGHANQVTGSLKARAMPLTVAEGEFRVPITAMTTGSSTRDCHMREALGIDYAHSRFPKQHVCANDRLPASGPDSVVYPEIVVKIRGLGPAQPAAPEQRFGVAAAPQSTSVPARLELSIHGITREVSAPLRLAVIKTEAVQVETEFDLKLADFGIVVNMPPGLRVADHTAVRLNLLLVRT